MDECSQQDASVDVRWSTNPTDGLNGQRLDAHSLRLGERGQRGLPCGEALCGRTLDRLGTSIGENEGIHYTATRMMSENQVAAG